MKKVGEFTDNYTFLFGGIFRLTNEKSFSTVTFTLNGGFENQVYDKKGFDNVVLKISAIPFSLFDKKS